MRTLSRPLERGRASHHRYRCRVSFLTNWRTRRKNVIMRRRRLTLVASLLSRQVRVGPRAAGYYPDDPTDPGDVPVVSTPPQTASTSTAPAAPVFARLGPPRDGNGDHTVRHIPIFRDHGVSPGRPRTSSSHAPWSLFQLFMHCGEC